VPVEELKQLDTRSAISDLKRIAEATPSLGFAFRSMVNQVSAGTLSPEEIAAKLNELRGPKGK